jgi:hypothetical protein
MKASKLEIGRAELENSSVALSRTHVVDSKIAFHNASFTNSTLYLSGIRIGDKGRVFFTRHIHDESNGPALTDTKIYLNDVGIGRGGFLGFQGQHFLRTPLNWQGLEMSDSEFVLTESVLESSQMTFEESEVDKRSSFVVDVCSDDANPVDLSNLSLASSEGVSVVTRPGQVDDVDSSRWAQPRTPQYAGVDAALRPHIKSWH